MMRPKSRLVKKAFADIPSMFSGHIAVMARDVEIRDRLAKLLREEGHSVTPLAGYAEVEDFFKRLEPQSNRFFNKGPTTLPKVVLIEDDGTTAAVQLARALRFQFADLQIVIIGDAPTAAIVQQAFQAGVADYLIQPTHPEKIKQTIRQALEHHTIFTLDSEMAEYRGFSEALKAISSCSDVATLNRLAPDIIASNLQASSTALYQFNAPEEGQWLPVSATGIERRAHAEGGRFLTWFFQKRWHRFNKTNILRGNHYPWGLKKLFGRQNMLMPIRHKEGLWGAMIVSRQQRLSGFNRRERARATAFGMHLARTYYILNHYRDTHQRAFIDQLTGLYNQRYFNFYGEHEFGISSRLHAPLSVLIVNILSFRDVNERLGHLAGGELLTAVAKVLKRAFRETDILIRLDGDIFLSLLRGTDNETAHIVEKRIYKQISESMITIKGDVSLHPKLSTSIAVYPDDGGDLQSILNVSLQRLKQARPL